MIVMGDGRSKIPLVMKDDMVHENTIQ